MNTTANNSGRGDLTNKMNIAISMTGATDELFATLKEYKTELDALIIAECGPSLLPPERADEYYRLKNTKPSFWIFGNRKRRAKRRLLKELASARKSLEEKAAEYTAENKVSVKLVFDNSYLETEWNSRLLYLGSSKQGNDNKTSIAVVVGDNREESLYQIAQEMVRNRISVSALICDFMVDNEPGKYYEKLDQNETIPSWDKLTFDSTGKDPTDSRNHKKVVEDKLIHGVKLIVDPAYSSLGPKSIVKGGITTTQSIDQIIPTLHAGPMIESEMGPEPHTLLPIEYASYVVLRLVDKNPLKDEKDSSPLAHIGTRYGWKVSKQRLHNVELRQGPLQVTDKEERAMAGVDHFRDQRDHAIRTRRRKRTWALGITSLLALLAGAVGTFTDVGTLVPEIKILNRLGLGHLAKERLGESVDTNNKELEAENERLKKDILTQTTDYQDAVKEIAELKKKSAGDLDKEAAEKIRRLEDKLQTRDDNVIDLKNKLAAAQAQVKEYIAWNKGYEKQVSDLETEWNLSKALLKASEITLQKKEAEIKRYESKGTFITSEEHGRYVQAEADVFQLKGTLRGNSQAAHKLDLKLRKLSRLLTTLGPEITTAKQRIVTLEKQLETANSGEAFAKYKARITAEYEVKMEDLRIEKDEEIEAKIAQIENARDEALAVFNSPVDNYGPYLKTGLSTKQVAAHFDKGFSRELEVAYGTQYQMFTVTRNDNKFLKIITANGRTEFRALKDLSDYVQKKIGALAKHLGSMDTRIDTAMKGKGVTVKYTGNGLYADIYLSVYKKNPTQTDLADFRKVINSKLDVEAMDGLSDLNPGDEFDISSD